MNELLEKMVEQHGKEIVATWLRAKANQIDGVPICDPPCEAGYICDSDSKKCILDIG